MQDNSIMEPAPEPGPRHVAGVVRFVDLASVDAPIELTRVAVADATMDVRVERILPAARGRLGEVIDDAIERELHGRHAGPPGIGATRDADSLLSDQLFRARHVGAPNLILTLPKLSPIAPESHGNALGAEDSATLLFWAKATRERPVTLRLDATDSALSAHVDPIPLRLALDLSRVPASPLRIPGTLVTQPTAPTTVPSPAPAAATPPAIAAPPRPAPSPPPAPSASVSPPPATPPEPDHWRTSTLALTAARGPQPLATLERLFASAYLPLDASLHDFAFRHAHAHAPDPRAVQARDEFRANFSRVYLEAFQSFAVTGKRPKMVLDAYETAARIARQNSARTSQVLLVDSLRYDLGTLVKEELTRTLASKATLTNELTLWSALPTTTTHQLATLAQGVSALQGVPEEEREDGALRGRTAQTIRRVKIGSRDVYKLDLCDVRVREAGERALPLFPSIATDVAAAIAKHALTLAPRTLLFVFGDHGFTLGRDGVPSSGGSSPEEVLVPAFAFLTGEAH
jgi:hypothetical protein